MHQNQRLDMLKNISKCIIPFVIILSGCQSLPQLFTAAEEIADDTAIKTEISREALQKDTDVEITIKVSNKDNTNASQTR
jgi:hypothetical protein